MKRYLLLIFILLSLFTQLYPQSEDVKAHRILNNEDNIVITPNSSSKLYFAKFFSELKNKKIGAFKYFITGVNKLFSSIYSKYLVITNIFILFLIIAFAVLTVYVFLINLKYTKTIIFKYFPAIYNNKVNYFIRFILKIFYYIVYLAGGWLLISIFTFPLYKKKELRKLLVLFFMAIIPYILVNIYPSIIRYPLKQKEMKMLKIADKNNMNREDLLYLRNNNFEFSHLKNLLLANYYENLNSNNQNIQLIIKNNYKNIIDSSFHSSEIFNNYAVASVKSKNLNNAEEIFESNLNNFGPSAITFYNLSQLYIINNNLELAELYYSKAKTLDNSIPNFNKSKPNFLLTSIKKSFILKNLFYYITHTDDSLPNFMNYLFIPYIILTFILIISFFISTFSSQYNSLTHCSSCNIPILPDSFVYQHSRNTFCPYCMNIIVNPQYTNLITHGQKYINRNTFLKSFLINFFLPGGGLIYAKSNLTGIILTFISLFLIIPLIFKDFLITYSYTDLLIIKNIYLFLPVFIIISNIIIFYFFKKRRL